ncbi:MAG: hypothetical protein AAGF24_06865 [Cyanobacteria bacterium P01_H01_bin.121]
MVLTAEQVDEAQAKVLGWLPDAAAEAVRSGGRWDDPDDHSPVNAMLVYLYDDDSELWSWCRVSICYRVECGRLLAFEGTVHQCGDAEENYHRYVTDTNADQGFMAWLQDNQGRIQQERDDSYQRYMAWVVEHGLDPLGQYFIPPSISQNDRLSVSLYAWLLSVRGAKDFSVLEWPFPAGWWTARQLGEYVVEYQADYHCTLAEAVQRGKVPVVWQNIATQPALERAIARDAAGHSPWKVPMQLELLMHEGAIAPAYVCPVCGYQRWTEEGEYRVRRSGQRHAE